MINKHDKTTKRINNLRMNQIMGRETKEKEEYYS